jgi:hypothetical protein
MAIISDPDQITPGTEVDFTVATQIITLAKSGNLSDDGITGQALYSYCKEEWKDDNQSYGLIKYPFPMLAITPEQFEFGNNGTTFSDWKLNSDASRKLMRFCGWRENNDTGGVGREYLGVVTLGTIDSTSKTVGDKAYYYVDGNATDKDTSFTEFTYAGPVNEAIQIFGDPAEDPTTTTLDYRDTTNTTGKDLVLRLRIFGKTYDKSSARAIGFDESNITYNAQRFPLAESTDEVISTLGVSTSDIDSNAPYTDMDIGWYSTAQPRSGFTSGTENFGIIIDGDVSVAQEDGGGAATAEQIYAWTQRQLIKDKATNINTQTGSTATNYYGVFVDEPLVLSATGGDLISQNIINDDSAALNGVYVDSFSTDDKNRVKFRDNGWAVPDPLIAFPFSATFNLQFNNNARNDSAARYWLYYRYTRETAVSDLTITPTSGATATIGSAAAVDFTSTADFGVGALSQNDYIEITGASNAVNNTVWQITSVPTANSFTADIVNGATPLSETAFAGNIYRTPIGSPDATLVENFANTPIGDALIGGAASIAFDYDYDQDTVGGRNVTQDAEVVLKVIGTTVAQYAEQNFTIARTTGQAFPITSAVERNYST